MDTRHTLMSRGLLRKCPFFVGILFGALLALSVRSVSNSLSVSSAFHLPFDRQILPASSKHWLDESILRQRGPDSWSQLLRKATSFSLDDDDASSQSQVETPKNSFPKKRETLNGKVDDTYEKLTALEPKKKMVEVDHGGFNFTAMKENSVNNKKRGWIQRKRLRKAENDGTTLTRF